MFLEDPPMRKVLLFLILLAWAGSEAPGQGADKTEKDLPPAARRVLEALNSGRRENLAQVIENEFHSLAFERRPRTRILDALAEVAAAGGGVEVRKVWTAETYEGAAVLTTRKAVSDFRGRTAVRWLYFEAVLAPAGDAQAGRIKDFTLQGIPNPDSASDPALAFPDRALPSEQAVAAEVQTRLAILADEDRFAGTVLVAKGDRVLFQRAYGDAEKNHHSPNEMDTVFHMASATKMFTSVAIARLVETGKLRFDEKLIEAWPNYPNRAVAERITLAQILNHTSGLGEGLTPDIQRADTPVRSLADAVTRSAGNPLLFKPGSRWSYSNLGYMVLGCIIEQQTCLSYEDYVDKNILKPSGLTRTGNHDLTSVIPGLAIGYGRQPDDPLGIRERRSFWPLVLGFRGTSAGGYFSTAPDMLRFLRALRTYKLLGREMTEFITSGKHKLSGGRQYAFGFWDTVLNGKTVRGHGGGGLGYGINTEANTFWTPGGETNDYAVVILSNYDPPAAQDFNKALLTFLAVQK
jgi:CubicO group peptidase (beta-lactamase class C family)